MMCMREHIHRLHAGHRIFFIQQLQVPGLCSRITADVDDGRSFHVQYLSHQLFVHAGPWRISYDDIGAAFGRKEPVITDLRHIPRKKSGMSNAIELRIFPGISDGFRDHLYADDAGSLSADKNADAARPAIKVIHRLAARQLRKLPGHLVKPLALPRIGLKKGFGPDLELEILQLLDDIPLSMYNTRLQVRYAVVPFGIDSI